VIETIFSAERNKDATLTGYRNFHPDLIIEATTVCDRACQGCYAPNVVSKKDIQSMYVENPALFLSSCNLSSSLNNSNGVAVIAIRGGEPTRHPKLIELLEIASHHAKEIYLETHGRWILSADKKQNSLSEWSELLDSCRQLNVQIKLSFDRMHGLSESELKETTETLAQQQIKWLVAITEPDSEHFQSTRAKCAWIPDHQIIFQKKALTGEHLIRPKVGVITVNGMIKSTVTSKFIAQEMVAL
jgi:organic radical activating enzyme